MKCQNRFESLEYKGDGFGLVLRGSRWVLRATTGENRYKYLTPVIHTERT